MVSSPRIDELKKKFDENPRRYFAPLANEYRKAGDLEQAIQLCRAYLPQQPGHMSGHIVFGQALFESAQLDEAKGVFETALTLDPENLIALRHLGDIALQAGDPATARQWYQRVLDADPRNEEIAAQIATLDAAKPETPVTPADAAAGATGGGMSGWGDINPEQAGAGQQAPPTPTGKPLELRDSISMPSIPPIPGPPAQRAAPPAPKPEPGLDLERDGEGAFAPPNPAAATRALDGVERSEEIDLRPRTSPAIETSGSGEVLVGHAPDVVPSKPTAKPEREDMQSFGSSNALGFETMEFVPPPRENDAPPMATPPSGFGVPFTGETAASTETPEAFVTETMAELYLQQGFTQEALAVYRQLLAKNPSDRGLRERVASLEGGSRSSVAAAAVSDEVIEHAQRRNAREPETIRSFFAALMRRRVFQRYEDSEEARAAGARADAAEEAAYGEALGASNAEPAGAAYDAAPEPWSGGEAAAQSSFDDSALDEAPTGDDAHALDDAFIVPDGVPLPPGVHPHDEHAHPAPVAATTDDFELAPPPDVSTPAQDEAYAAALYTPTDTEPAPREEGTIDLLFNSNGASSEDERAASVLSGAFPAVESQALGGRPAERATTELSLDHVFREADRKTGRASGNFSFDQFFSETGGASQKQPQRPTDPGGTAVGGPELAPDDDVAQFNDWLTGLKKK
jgi:tetratricopeptide (TPR) repeat protein